MDGSQKYNSSLRSSVLAGVALGQPAVALAAKLGARAARSGLAVELPAGDSVGEQLFRLAFRAGERGEDPEAELRAVAKQVASRLRGLDPFPATRTEETPPSERTGRG